MRLIVFGLLFDSIFIAAAHVTGIDREGLCTRSAGIFDPVIHGTGKGLDVTGHADLMIMENSCQ